MQNIQILNKIDDVPLAAEAFLGQDPIRNNIALGTLVRLRSQPGWSGGTIILAQDDSSITAYAHCIAPYPLVLAQSRPEILTLMAQELRQIGLKLPGLHGSKEAVEGFLQGWPALRDRIKKREAQGLYRLDQVIHPPATGAAFGLASSDEVPTLIAWHKAFAEETGDLALAEPELQRLVEARIQSSDLFVLRREGALLSMASATRTSGSGRALSFIYTPPDSRGRGYAGELTALASEHILRSGFTFCCLFTQLSNPTSNRIYQAVGYRWVDEYTLLTLA